MSTFYFPPQGGSGGGGSSDFVIVVPPEDGGAGIQAAIDEAGAAGGGIVQLLEGSYEVSGTDYIVWDDGAGTAYNNVILQGVGDATIINVTIPATDPATNPWAFYMSGSGNSNVACNATTQLATTITTTTAANASGFVANAKVCITGYLASGAIRKETNEVVSNNPGTGVVTLRFPLQNSLATTVTMTAHNAGFNNGIQNLKIVRGTTSASHALALNQQWGSFAKNVTMDGNLGEGGVGFSLLASVYCDVQDNEMLNWFELEEYPIGNFTHVGTDIQNNYDCNFINNKISNCSNSSLNDACVNFAILDRCTIENNTIQNCIIGARLGNFVSRTSFVNNYIPRATRYGIAGTNGTVYDQVSFESNVISGSGNFYSGIYIGGASGTFADILVSGNKVSGTVANEAGIHLQRITGGSVVGNIVSDNGQEGIYLNACVGVACTGNELTENTYAGLTLLGSSNVSISGNAINSNGRGIFSFGSTNTQVVISGNTCRSNSTTNITVDNSDTNFTISGNDFGATLVTYGTGTGHLITGNKDGTAYSQYVTYTPTVTLVGGAGNTTPVYVTNQGRYTINGKTVTCSIFLEGDGGADGAGSGVIYVALPIASAATTSGWYNPCGFLQNGANNYMVMGAVVAGQANVALSYQSSLTAISDFVGASQDSSTRRINLNFSYEIA